MKTFFNELWRRTSFTEATRGRRIAIYGSNKGSQLWKYGACECSGLLTAVIYVHSGR